MTYCLFVKEYLSFIIFEFVLVLFIMLLYWLDGFRNVDTAVYSIVISFLLIVCFLGLRYLLRHRYYKKIVQKPTKMEDALQKNARTLEHAKNENYMQELYRIYQYEVQALYATQNRHLQFMNQWVHQMKTPISVLELLLQEGELDRKSIQEEIDRLKTGLEMVLVNARIETFEQDLQVEQVSLKQLVVETVNEHKRLFIIHRVYPQIDIDDKYHVTTDSKWMKFVIGQFITNAVKYTFETDKKVYISAQCQNGTAVLKVRDEGIGIPASDINRVTKEFFTGENGRRSGESTGMGLYLAKVICEKLGHEFTIESEVGKGTTVTIIFHQLSH